MSTTKDLNIKGNMLHDKYYDKHGKEKDRPWNDKKHKNQWYSKMLYSDGMFGIMSPSVIDNIEHCGEHLEFYKMDDGRLRLNRAFFCKNRLCPMCMWRLSLKRGAINKKIVNHVLKGYPNAKILMLTLTVPNVKGEDLGKTVSNLSKSFNKMMKYVKVKKNLIAYMRKFEYTVKRQRVNKNEFNDERFDVIEDLAPNDLKGDAYAVQYHPHLHVMLVVRSTYFKGAKNYIEQKEWQELWERACKNWLPGVNLVVDVRKVNKEKKSEIAKLNKELSKNEYGNEIVNEDADGESEEDGNSDDVQGAINEMSKDDGMSNGAVEYFGKKNDWMGSSPYYFDGSDGGSDEDDEDDENENGGNDEGGGSDDDVMASYDEAMRQKKKMLVKMRKFDEYDPDIACDVVVMRVLNKELHGKRTIGYGGEFKEYYRALKANEEDLVHIDEDNNKGGEVKHKIGANWNGKFYKITRDEVISVEQDQKETEEFIETMKNRYHYRGNHELNKQKLSDDFYTKAVAEMNEKRT